MQREQLENNQPDTRETMGDGLAFIIFEEIDEEQAVKELDHQVDRRLHGTSN